jgi:PPOX class probable F420-dependent enzyme
MIDLIPPHYQYLLTDETKAYCRVATMMPNGGPQLTCVWFNTDGEHILFNSTNKSAKYRYLTSNPKVAVAIVDPNNPQKYMQIRGTVELTEEGAEAHTNALSQKYTGENFTLIPGYKRVMFKLTPKRVTLWPPKR